MSKRIETSTSMYIETEQIVKCLSITYEISFGAKYRNGI